MTKPRRPRESAASTRRRSTAPPAQEPPAAPARPLRGSLGEWLDFLGAELSDNDWIPAWPPDAFAISAAFLRRTGGYVSLVNGSHKQNQPSHPVTVRSPLDVGLEWRNTLKAYLSGSDKRHMRHACPPEIKAWWHQLRNPAHLPVMDAALKPGVVNAACMLCVASDAACANIGVSVEDDQFLATAQEILSHNEYRSFCLSIPSDKLAVLGKRHTPQRGCTIRSLTHHLALYNPTEIRAFWHGPYRPAAQDPDVINLLLLPWPTTIAAGDFRTSLARNGLPTEVPSGAAHRYFDFEPNGDRPAGKLASMVKRALAKAREHASRIHGLVFPELALTTEQFVAVEKIAVSERAMLVAGVRSPGEPGSNNMPLNLCAIQPLGWTGIPAAQLSQPLLRERFRQVQLKHHRWCLDRDQVMQYELGGRLPASRDCWERVFLGDRHVNFVTLGSWLTVCVLICEDLARQDPVAEVIRAVGPNIVFALLMDGPQLKKRWPARYASVLAEDPGSSVLTMTSLGMAKRSKPKEGETPAADADTMIALWRDAIFGEKEIGVKSGHDACVLSLVCRSAREYTIDGRSDQVDAHFPVFAGAYSFKTDELPARAAGPTRYNRNRRKP
jgi:hypothetical protein